MKTFLGGRVSERQQLCVDLSAAIALISGFDDQIEARVVGRYTVQDMIVTS